MGRAPRLGSSPLDLITGVPVPITQWLGGEELWVEGFRVEAPSELPFPRPACGPPSSDFIGRPQTARRQQRGAVLVLGVYFQKLRGTPCV